jgi:hypothetical protein
MLNGLLDLKYRKIKMKLILRKTILKTSNQALKEDKKSFQILVFNSKEGKKLFSRISLIRTRINLKTKERLIKINLK